MIFIVVIYLLDLETVSICTICTMRYTSMVLSTGTLGTDIGILVFVLKLISVLCMFPDQHHQPSGNVQALLCILHTTLYLIHHDSCLLMLLNCSWSYYIGHRSKGGYLPGKVATSAVCFEPADGPGAAVTRRRREPVAVSIKYYIIISFSQ